MTTVLVLGSSGQIGAYLVMELRKQGYEVLEFDIANRAEEDLRKSDNQILEMLVQKSDYVYFLAFDVGGSGYLEQYQDSIDFISSNVRIMENTFRILCRLEKKFLFASSQMSNMTHSTYGVLKLLGEKYAKSLPLGRTVHFWNVYGFEKDVEKFHVISDFAIMAKFNRIIKMRTTGTEERSFLYAIDCCQALIRIMELHNQIPHNAPLHLTSFKSNKILEIAELIANYYDAEILPGNKVDTVQLDARNEADPYILNFWSPKTTLSDGIYEVLKRIDQQHLNSDKFKKLLER
jgi:nucleoside-diphosphate-sugar epimerase